MAPLFAMMSPTRRPNVESLGYKDALHELQSNKSKEGKAPKRKRQWIEEKLTVAPTLPPYTEEEMRALEVKSKVDAQDVNGCWAKAKVLEKEPLGLVITYVGFKKEWDTLYTWEDHAKLAPPESRVIPPPKRIPKKPKVRPPSPPPKIDRGPMWDEVERRQKEKGARSSYKPTDIAGEDEKWELEELGRAPINAVLDSTQDVPPGKEELDKPVPIWDMCECSARQWGRSSHANWRWQKDCLEFHKLRLSLLHTKKMHEEAEKNGQFVSSLNKPVELVASLPGK